MKSVVDRRGAGIPGSDASAFVEAMGGPVAQRASRTTTEWKPVRYSRAEVRRRLAEQTAQGRRTPGDPLPPRRSTETLPGPRQRRQLHAGVPLLLGALGLMALYLLIGLAYSAWIGISNRLSYGPTPTSYLQAVVGDHDARDHPTWVAAMNERGSIVIQVAPGGDFSKAATFTIAAQTFHSWGDLDDVVVTLTVDGSGSTPNILVTLQGDPDLSHFYQRPSVSFLLLNQRPGFRVGPIVNQ